MKYYSERKAAEAWVNTLNAISTGMVSKLISYEPEEWIEVTVPTVGDSVYSYEAQKEGEIVGEENGVYLIELDDSVSNGLVYAKRDEFELTFDNVLPMWGTMWSFDEQDDYRWLLEEDGLKKMSDCGFRIFLNDDFGYIFGIDGAGYDFYDNHWIPLYKSRGLRWHMEAIADE